MSSVSSDPNRPADAEGSSTGAPLGLHKMSTTAGVGSQDYVAINNLAVTALFFGFISGLALFGFIMLIIPLAGILMGIAALRQIGNSGGTQSGRLLAWGGIVLAVFFSGLLVTRTVAAAIEARADRESLTALVNQLDKDIRDKKYDAAYAVFTEQFQVRVSRTQFENRFEEIQSLSELGGLKQIHPATRFAFFDLASERMANSFVRFEFGNAERTPVVQDVTFRRIDGRWLINDIPTLFPPPNPGGPGGPGGGGMPR